MKALLLVIMIFSSISVQSQMYKVSESKFEDPSCLKSLLFNGELNQELSPFVMNVLLDSEACTSTTITKNLLIDFIISLYTGNVVFDDRLNESYKSSSNLDFLFDIENHETLYLITDSLLSFGSADGLCVLWQTMSQYRFENLSSYEQDIIKEKNIFKLMELAILKQVNNQINDDLVKCIFENIEGFSEEKKIFKDVLSNTPSSYYDYQLNFGF
jgi:hypothetical protein